MATSTEKDLAEREIAVLRAGWHTAIFRKLFIPRRKKKYASRFVPLRFIDVNRAARVSMEIGLPRGGESNRICSADIFAGENSTSISLPGNKAIKNASARGWRGSASEMCRRKLDELNELARGVQSEAKLRARSTPRS